MNRHLAVWPQRSRFSHDAVIDWPWLALGVNLVAVLVVAIVLRFWRLDCLPGVNGDEAWSGVQAMHWLQGEPMVWRTPSGNLLNPFWFGPLVALHALFPPSFGLLRLLAVASGLLALGVNYLLCRRVFGTSTARISTLILAVLPFNIAYSRLGWDASQTLLATLPVVYLPLLLMQGTRRPALVRTGAMLAWGAAVLVHPTNLFCGVFLMPLVWQSRAQLKSWYEHKVRPHGLWWAAVAVATASILVTLGGPTFGVALRRLAAPGEMLAFAGNFVRFFSGHSVYTYIAGSDGGPAAWGGGSLAWADAAWLLLFAWGAAGLATALRASTAQTERCLACSWTLLVIGFFLVAGPRAIAPHFERYGACLIAPTVLLIAIGINDWLTNSRAACRRQIVVVVSLLAWLTLAQFGSYYFAFLLRTGGESHRTFRTAVYEPKQSALNLILRESGTTAPVWVVADDWWSYWPLAYLATPYREVHVVRAEDLPADLAPAVAAGRVGLWFVSFSDNQDPARRQLDAWGLTGRKIILADAAGRPLLALVRVSTESTQNN